MECHIATHATVRIPGCATSSRQPHHEQSPAYLAFLVLGSSSSPDQGGGVGQVRSDSALVYRRGLLLPWLVLIPPYRRAVSKLVAVLALADRSRHTITLHMCECIYGSYTCILSGRNAYTNLTDDVT
jgi:hypothetical protein